MTMVVSVSSTSKVGVSVSSSFVKAMVPSCYFSSPIVGMTLVLGLTLVFGLTNFQYDLGSSLTLVAMFLSNVTLASLMRLVVLLCILLKSINLSLSFVK